MKRLLKELILSIVLVILIVIILALSCLSGFGAMNIAKKFTTSKEIIMLVGVIGYTAIISIIFILESKLTKKRKNSQKNARK